VQISPVGGAATVNVSSLDILAADTDNTNTLTIEDIGGILSYYTDFEVPVAAQTPEDIDDTQSITITDVALSIINFTQLTVYGDQ